MKKILFLLLLLPISLVSQELAKDIYGYSKVYEVDGRSPNEIYKVVKEWIGTNFNSAEEIYLYDTKEKVIIKNKFKMSPRILQTAQNTTSNYRVSSKLIFFIVEDKLKLEIHLEDLYSFDGKKGEPNTHWEIPSNKIDENFIKKLLFTGYLNVKQFSGGLLQIEKKGDKKSKKATKYVAKELKKGIYIKRVAKVASDLNAEIKSIYNSVDEHLKNSIKENSW